MGSIPTSGARHHLRLHVSAPTRAGREQPEVYALGGRGARDPKAVGAPSETTVAPRLMRAGFDVARPFGDNARDYLVIDDGSKLVRVQVKTGRSSRVCGIVVPKRSVARRIERG